MLNARMREALNDHMAKEFYSAYLYMSMSAHSSSTGLKGFATWFMVQYHEEMAHAMTIYDYLNRQGAKVRLLEIKEPPSGYDSMLDIFEKTLEHERYMTKNINELVDLAIKENDHATKIMMQWFVSEQVEEEDNVDNILKRLKLVGNDANGLFMMDSELGQRVVRMPLDFSKGIDLTANVAG